MAKSSIRVEGVGKLYQLAHQSTLHTSFSEALTAAALAPLRRFRQLRGTDTSMEDFWALRDVSFDGAAGRGGRHHRPQRRRQEHAAEDPVAASPSRPRAARRCTAASQPAGGRHRLPPELTGRENIFLNGAILGMTPRGDRSRKFDEIVAFAEVEQFLDTPVKRYSSGMYVRLAFAVAAHLEPEILIVDEVLAVGDAEFQKKCLGKMNDVAAGGPHRAVRQPQHGRRQHLVQPSAPSLARLAQGRRFASQRHSGLSDSCRRRGGGRSRSVGRRGSRSWHEAGLQVASHPRSVRRA